MQHYQTVVNVEQTHDHCTNNSIHKTLEKLNSSNICNLQNDDTVHIFLDNNYFGNAIERFISEVDKYVDKCIKIYFVKNSEIYDYMYTIKVTPDNISEIKFVTNIQKEIHDEISLKKSIDNFIDANSIKKYVMYCAAL